MIGGGALRIPAATREWARGCATRFCPPQVRKVKASTDLAVSRRRHFECSDQVDGVPITPRPVHTTPGGFGPPIVGGSNEPTYATPRELAQEHDQLIHSVPMKIERGRKSKYERIVPRHMICKTLTTVLWQPQVNFSPALPVSAVREFFTVGAQIASTKGISGLWTGFPFKVSYDMACEKCAHTPCNLTSSFHGLLCAQLLYLSAKKKSLSVH